MERDECMEVVRMMFRKKKSIPLRNRERVLCSKREIDTRIARGIEALDRANNHCANCDSKASIALAIAGVILAALLEDNGEGVIFKQIKSYFCLCKGLSFHNVWGIISILLILLGIFMLCLCVLASLGRLSKHENDDSVVYFNRVAGYKSIEDYFDKLRSITDERYWIDLETQVYRVSKIARMKYTCFNMGIIMLLIGIAAICIEIAVIEWICKFLV